MVYSESLCLSYFCIPQWLPLKKALYHTKKALIYCLQTMEIWKYLVYMIKGICLVQWWQHTPNQHLCLWNTNIWNCIYSNLLKAVNIRCKFFFCFLKSRFCSIWKWKPSAFISALTAAHFSEQRWRERKMFFQFFHHERKFKLHCHAIALRGKGFVL